MNKPDAPAIEILEGFWLDLKPHSERGALFVVAQDLDLMDVATRMAKDDVEAISAWITDASLNRPTNEQLKTWDSAMAKSFRFAIVQPYVLIQEQGH